MRLKICGITNKQDLLNCLPYVDAVGFIVGYPSSPRSITIENAKKLMSCVPPFINIVIVIPDFQKVMQIYRELQPDTIQLHGDETVKDVQTLRKNISCKIIKACGATNAVAFSKHVDAILIDDKYEPYHLSDINHIISESTTPVILAGHITSDNILEILEKVQPYAVDVASGVEQKPGIKDISKIEQLRKNIDLGPTVRSIIHKKKKQTDTFQLYAKLKKNKTPHIITEIKPASPLKGTLRVVKPGLKQIIKEMESGGASALSVLIEPLYFHGSIDLIKRIKKLTHLPLIAKGFIYTSKHIQEIADAGAQAFLLMTRVVESQGKQLSHLIEIGTSYGLDAMVEVSNPDELTYALHSGAKIIEVNNRDIYGNLTIDFTASHIGKNIPSDIIFVSASGINTSNDIQTLYTNSNSRINAFLIGTSIMQSKTIKETIEAFVKAAEKVCS